MTSIPLSKDFSIAANVISPAGTGVDMNGLMLTTSTAISPANINYLSSLAVVGDLFGADSDEYEAASLYFNGFENSATTPSQLLVVGIPDGETSGTLTSGSNSSVTIASINLLPTGTITVSVDGASQVSSSINLSAVSTQSDVASALQAALTGVTVSWNASTSRYVISSATTGENSSVSFASGEIATALKMTDATGAILAKGVDDLTLTELMNYIVDRDTNWFDFASASELTDDQKLELAAWTSSYESGTRFAYAMNDNNTSATISNNENSLAKKVIAAGYAGVLPFYGPAKYAFTVLAFSGSLSFSTTNGRLSFKFRTFTGLSPNVDRLSVARALESNGYSYYGQYGLNAVTAQYSSTGAITGKFLWLDTFIDQVWIKANLISSFTNLFKSNQSYSFNDQGYTSVKAATIDPMTAAKNFGAIQTGVTLDESQRRAIQLAVGKDVSGELYANGYYLYIPTQSGANRIERSLKGVILFWTDGQLIQSIEMQSTTVL